MYVVEHEGETYWTKSRTVAGQLRQWLKRNFHHGDAPEEQKEEVEAAKAKDTSPEEDDS